MIWYDIIAFVSYEISDRMKMLHYMLNGTLEICVCNKCNKLQFHSGSRVYVYRWPEKWNRRSKNQMNILADSWIFKDLRCSNLPEYTTAPNSGAFDLFVYNFELVRVLDFGLGASVWFGLDLNLSSSLNAKLDGFSIKCWVPIWITDFPNMSRMFMFQSFQFLVILSLPSSSSSRSNSNINKTSWFNHFGCQK